MGSSRLDRGPREAPLVGHFAEVSGLFARYIGLAPPEAALLTTWNCTYVVRESCIPQFSPTMVISGPDMAQPLPVPSIVWPRYWERSGSSKP